MIYGIGDAYGQVFDARIELDGGDVILHSRGGPTGGRPPRNTEYMSALKTILRRLLAHPEVTPPILSQVLLDSSPVRSLPREARRLATGDELAELTVDEAVSLIGQRARTYGQDADAIGGNSTKRLRFETRLSRQSIRATLYLRRVTAPSLTGFVSNQSGGDSSGSYAATAQEAEAAFGDMPPTDEELGWAEGDIRIVDHLRRERQRNSGAAKAKREAMVEAFGRLLCERCGEDYQAMFAPDVAAGVFDVHHTIPLAEMGQDHVTVVDDLECLCATCHRATHREMTLGKQ